MPVSLQRQCVNASHAQPDYWPWLGQQPMDSLPLFFITHDFNLLANHMFQCFSVFLYKVQRHVLNSYSQTYRQSYSCSYNVTERSFRGHWIPQCGPGNKAADGALYASHTPCPSRLQHPWSSYRPRLREAKSPLRNVHGL